MRTLGTWLRRTLLLLPLATLLAAVLALLLALQGTPSVAERADVSPADVERAVALVRRHDPRRGPPGQRRWLMLGERDADLLVQHAAQRWLGVATRVRLRPGGLLLQASVAAPAGRWLNVELLLRQGTGLPEPERLRIGRLPLPAALVLPALRMLAARHGVAAEVLIEPDWIERVVFTPGRLLLSYRLDAATTQRLRAALVPAADEQRLRAHAGQLAALVQPLPGRTVALEQLLLPMLRFAGQRAAAAAAGSGADGEAAAAAEHRAALLVLAFYANQRPLQQWLPAAAAWPAPRPLVVTLQQRHDTALHFLVSAVIAAESGTPLAEAVGLWKELADARRGGSGFSFHDLAADRAGTRLGERAVREPQRLQARLAGAAGEQAFMPAAADLPEQLTEDAFLARYDGVGGAGYQRLVAAIDARIGALPLHR